MIAGIELIEPVGLVAQHGNDQSLPAQLARQGQHAGTQHETLKYLPGEPLFVTLQIALAAHQVPEIAFIALAGDITRIIDRLGSQLVERLRFQAAAPGDHLEPVAEPLFGEHAAEIEKDCADDICLTL